MERLLVDISDRDSDVLRTAHLHRFLSTRQLERLNFWDHASTLSGARTARRVLRRLGDLGVLNRLDRRVGGVRAGSEATIWDLSETGHRVLRALPSSASQEPSVGRQRFHEPSLRLLDHCLGINEVAICMLELARAGQSVHTASLELDPVCWRAHDGIGGARRLLKPDLAAMTTSQSNDGQLFEDRWFFEVDMGWQHEPTLLIKCREYQEYRASGKEQSAHEVFPMVVWVMDRPERAQRLRTALIRSRDIDERLFRVVTLDDLGPLVNGGAE